MELKRVKRSLEHRLGKYVYSEKHYLEMHVSYLLGYKADLQNPKTFNEKLNWLKLHDQNPIYSKMVDKFEAKKIVTERIGAKYVVPCYGVWNSFDDIPLSELPNQFVLKATHQSGVCVVKDKNTYDFSKAKNKFDTDMKRNYYTVHKEWVYKNTPPRILADKFLDDHTGNQLQDYKFWCFNGEPKVMYMTIKGENVYENFYDMDFRPVEINHGFPRREPEFDRPALFDEMKELAKILAGDIPFVRIDFFNVNGHVYFGEFTFYDWGGVHPFETYEQDLMIGAWMQLPNIG